MEELFCEICGEPIEIDDRYKFLYIDDYLGLKSVMVKDYCKKCYKEIKDKVYKETEEDGKQLREMYRNYIRKCDNVLDKYKFGGEKKWLK